MHTLPLYMKLVSNAGDIICVMGDASTFIALSNIYGTLVVVAVSFTSGASSNIQSYRVCIT